MSDGAADPVRLIDELDEALAIAPESAVRRREAPAELLGRQSVRGLLWLTAQEWAMLAVLWLAMGYAPHALYPVLALLVAGRLHALGVIVHDAVHMPLRVKTLAVRVLEATAGYPVATTLDAMRYHHLRHHRDNGMPTDPYFKAGLHGNRMRWVLMWLRGILLIPFWNIRPLFGVLAFYIPSLRNAYGRLFLQDRSGRDLRDSAEVARCAREELGQLVFLFAVIALWIRFPVVLYGFVIPLVATGLLASKRLLAEHNYLPAADRRVETIFATTCDHGLGILGAVLLAPRNVGCHVVHHIHPQVALQLLPRLRSYYLQRYPDLYPRPHRIPLPPSGETNESSL